MSSDTKNTESGEKGSASNSTRLVLLAGCVLVVVLAALLVPTLGSGDLAGSPIDTVLPGERFEDSGGGDSQMGSSGFGALNPGDQTGVGGETGFDSDTFGANDTSVHFEVESSQPAYWRTGSYDTYTGTGWERDGETVAFEPPLEPVGLTDGSLEFEITFAEPATAIPTAWQPERLSGVTGLAVTEDGGLRLSEPLDQGTTISGVSQVQEDDIDLLRAAGEEYPADIEEQYTQLPDDTPDRVRAFTDELTADADNPYDAAVAIQDWLRTNKSYSLQADERSDSIADTFIFEMEAGYCEYFATSMTTMLRSQGIPARYTIGYTTGQPVDDNTYEVRGMNAHAWVEVYFPDVGWVRFDPTPGDSRLDSQSAVLEDELGDEFALQEPGSPGEVFEPGEIQEAEPDDSDDDEETDGAYDISLNRTAVPGMPVEITVTQEGAPVPLLNVTVNGENVGTTDGKGAVVITVPDEDELAITVRPSRLVADVGENGTRSVTDPDGFRGGSSATLGDRGTLSSQRFPTSAVGAAPTAARTATLPADGLVGSRSHYPIEENGMVPMQWDRNPSNESANRTVQVERNATLSITGDTFPGEQVTVTATVRDVAIPDAAVFVDGSRVGTTDGNGRANVTLPDQPGDAVIAVERGSISGDETVTLPELTLAVETGTPLPFTTATATVTAGERTVANAPVLIDGEQVATTGADGSATVRLPLSPSATVETGMYGLTASETVDGLLRNLAVFLAGSLLALAVPVAVLRRRNVSPGTVLARGRAWLAAAVTYTQRLLVTGARYGVVALVSVPDRVRTTLAYAFQVLRGELSLGELWLLFRTWAQSKRSTFQAVAGDERVEDDAVAVVDGIQHSWTAFLSHVSVADPSAHTPAELATHAVETDGLPPEAVGTLLTAFREVEYGSRPERDRLERVERALARIEAHADDPSVDEGDAEPEPAEYGVEQVSADGGTSAGHTTADDGTDGGCE